MPEVTAVTDLNKTAANLLPQPTPDNLPEELVALAELAGRRARLNPGHYMTDWADDTGARHLRAVRRRLGRQLDYIRREIKIALELGVKSEDFYVKDAPPLAVGFKTNGKKISAHVASVYVEPVGFREAVLETLRAVTGAIRARKS